LQTGADLLTDKQRARLAALFAVDAHAEVEATWTMYQRTVAAYRHPDRKKGSTPPSWDGGFGSVMSDDCSGFGRG